MTLRLFIDPCDFCESLDSMEMGDFVRYAGTMPTAIVSVYTPEGFVVAADGLSTTGGSDAQKVFPIPNSSTPTAAYAISGWAGVSDEDIGLDISFDGECRAVANSLDWEGFVDLNTYGETFARTVGVRIQQRITEARVCGAISESDYTEKIANCDRGCLLHFNGYFRGVPSMAAWSILFHLDQSSVNQYYSWQPVSADARNFYGSTTMFDLLKSDVDCGYFQKYKTPGFKKLIARGGVSLQEAIQATSSYIEACRDPKANALDSKCEAIGGRIHIATIKPLEGFGWAPGQEPLSACPNTPPPA
jgi:hypothetical protein